MNVIRRQMPEENMKLKHEKKKSNISSFTSNVRRSREEEVKLHVYANDSICRNHCYLYVLPLCILLFVYGSIKAIFLLIKTDPPRKRNKKEINADRRSRNNEKAEAKDFFTMP
jgi:hypothetical protein